MAMGCCALARGAMPQKCPQKCIWGGASHCSCSLRINSRWADLQYSEKTTGCSQNPSRVKYSSGSSCKSLFPLFLHNPMSGGPTGDFLTLSQFKSQSPPGPWEGHSPRGHQLILADPQSCSLEQSPLHPQPSRHSLEHPLDLQSQRPSPMVEVSPTRSFWSPGCAQALSIPSAAQTSSEAVEWWVM